MKFKQLGREALILTSFSIVMWGILYLPLPVMEGFNYHQWIIWFRVTTWYDLPMEYIGAKILIWFNSKAKAKHWY